MPRSKHVIVCLVGSTKPKWRKQYAKVNKELGLAGYLVISVSCFKDDVKDLEEHRDLLESVHMQKMDLADIVVIVHRDALGTHTIREIEYCNTTGKPTVFYTKNITETDRLIQQIIENVNERERHL